MESRKRMRKDQSNDQHVAPRPVVSARSGGEEPTNAMPLPPPSDQSPDTRAEVQTSESGDPEHRRDLPAHANHELGQRKSWYGSWTQKSQPVSAVETESVTAERRPSAASISNHSVHASRTASSAKRYLSGSRRPITRDTPLETSMTKLTVTSSTGKVVGFQPDEPPTAKSEPAVDPPLPPAPQAPTSSRSGRSVEDAGQTSQTSLGWFGWWSRPDGFTDHVKSETDLIAVAQKTPLPVDSPTGDIPKPSTDTTKDESTTTPSITVNHEASNQEPAATGETQSRSWFWLWTRAQNAQNDPSGLLAADPKHTETHLNIPKSNPGTIDAAKTNQTPQDAVSTTSQEERDAKSSASVSKPSTQQPKSSGWAFWSRQLSEPKSNEEGQIHRQVGELAVADTPSQSCPEAAQFNEREQPPNGNAPDSRASTPIGERKLAKDSRTSKKTPGSSQNDTRAGAKSQVVEAPLAPAMEPAKHVSKDRTQPNLLLPEFQSTYSQAQEPTYLQQVLRFFVKGGGSETSHIHISPSPPRISKALAIGVHGFFPSPIFQKVLGPPTGTSIRFANAAAAAIKQWTESRGYMSQIETVALEGEGLIAERVDTLWKLLLNWIDHIRQADFILMACHSQGVPVAIMLVAKLIEFGCVNAARVGVCAMAGVNLGPFIDYKTRMFGSTALELFDFSDPASKVSSMYQASLDRVLRHGVRIVYVGSIDDQLVSLESSTFSNVSHPYIYRAVFVDGRIHAADFITQLVGFALKLRNLGLPDHGLIRELSPALAGSLYTGEGHSRLYDDMSVYSLAVSHALETTSLESEVPVVVREYEGPPGFKEGNPYFLPWAMRGVLDEERVRMELGDECRRLLELFDEWRPTSKGLKDVKFRLEALKSKL